MSPSRAPKEERYVEARKKIEPRELAETKLELETLTTEENRFTEKQAEKSKNYLPVGRRSRCMSRSDPEHPLALEEAADHFK